MASREPDIGSSYFFDEDESINGTLYFSKKLLLEASNLERRIILITPAIADLNDIHNGKDYKNLKWYRDLKKISSETNSTIFDLADHIEKKDFYKIMLECDGHWNPYGTRVVVELVKKKFFK